jgi:hypothetical protein
LGQEKATNSKDDANLPTCLTAAASITTVVATTVCPTFILPIILRRKRITTATALHKYDIAAMDSPASLGCCCCVRPVAMFTLPAYPKFVPRT